MAIEHVEAVDATYRAEIEAERQRRAAAISADLGWLTLAGLYWLQPGDNSLGSDANADVTLPNHTAPRQAGLLRYVDDQVILMPAPGADIQIEGAAATEQALQHDTTAAPTYVTIGSLIFVVVRRGQRVGLRLWDTASPARENFRGLVWYPVDLAHRVGARFVAYDTPRTVQGVDVLGDIYAKPSPGYVEFSWHDTHHRLQAEARRGRLFFNFRDQTNRETTYEAGRFLYADAPVDGEVTLDFNRATNPFCAYTEYATCPLPPAQNRLPVRIEAGEQTYPR